MSQPFFSILMPLYNARPHLSRVLGDLLAQTFRDFEIIAVDDGSTDGSAEVLRCHDDKRLRVISLPKNIGLVGALNAGLAQARGIWIARQDADDRCRDDRLKRQCDLILARPEAVLFYSCARLIDGRERWRGTMRPPLDDAGLRWDLCFRNAVPHTSVVFPAKLVRDELNGYSGDNVTADIDLWSRLLRRGKAAGDPRRLVSYRNHSDSIMGRVNQSSEKPSNAGLRMILVRNLVDWAGANAEEAGLIADAWLFPADANWELYFSIREQLAANHSGLSASMIAEEDYTLLHSAAAVSPDCASAMLKAMRGGFARRYSSLPQLRTFLSRIIGGF
jgi:glycosyltransferase involved in cell wall biosynthesis